MAEVILEGGEVALVDDADLALVIGYSWHAVTNSGKNIYAVTQISIPGFRRKSISMHRLILDAPADLKVDHRDGNGLDNRRENLRLATSVQNARNSRLSERNTSGYKGVSRKTAHKKWTASIRLGGKVRHLGFFETPEEAARAYNAAAVEHYGEFARPNIVPETGKVSSAVAGYGFSEVEQRAVVLIVDRGLAQHEAAAELGLSIAGLVNLLSSVARKVQAHQEEVRQKEEEAEEVSILAGITYPDRRKERVFIG